MKVLEPEPPKDALSSRQDFNEAAKVAWPPATTDRAVWDAELRAYRLRRRERVESLLASGRLVGEALRCAESVLRVHDPEREREERFRAQA